MVRGPYLFVCLLLLLTVLVGFLAGRGAHKVGCAGSQVTVCYSVDPECQ